MGPHLGPGPSAWVGMPGHMQNCRKGVVSSRCAAESWQAAARGARWVEPRVTPAGERMWYLVSCGAHGAAHPPGPNIARARGRPQARAARRGGTLGGRHSPLLPQGVCARVLAAAALPASRPAAQRWTGWRRCVQAVRERPEARHWRSFGARISPTGGCDDAYMHVIIPCMQSAWGNARRGASHRARGRRRRREPL